MAHNTAKYSVYLVIAKKYFKQKNCYLKSMESFSEDKNKPQTSLTSLFYRPHTHQCWISLSVAVPGYHFKLAFEYPVRPCLSCHADNGNEPKYFPHVQFCDSPAPSQSPPFH